MGGGEQRSLAQDAEGVIRRIRGVSATRVDLGADGRIEQVHVLGSADRTARVVVGDVIAALGAVETYLRTDAAFRLALATVAPLGLHRVAIAIVTWMGPEEELLSGAAIVHDDPREAVVRAVLDAVNRPVSWLGAR